jgi:hypothetical protein
MVDGLHEVFSKGEYDLAIKHVVAVRECPASTSVDRGVIVGCGG